MRARWLPWILAAVLWPAILPFPFLNNTGQFALMASRWAAGDVLYRDIADNRPPLSYAIWRVGLAVFGPARPYVWLELAVQIAMLAGILAFARRAWGERVALRAAVVWVVTSFGYLRPDFIAESETFCMPLVLAAMALALFGPADRRGAFLTHVGLGAVGGLLVAIKLVPGAIAGGAWLWRLDRRRREGRLREELTLAVAGFAIGLAAAVVPWIVYLHRSGGLPSILRLWIDWGGPPTDVSSLPSRLLRTAGGLPWGLVYYVPAGILGLLALPRLRKVARAPADSLAIACIAAALFAVALQDLWYGYHFLLALPPLAMLAGRWWEIVRSEANPTGGRAGAVILAALLVLSPFVPRIAGHPPGAKWWWAARYAAGLDTRESYVSRFAVPGIGDPAADEAAARRLARETRAEDRVLLWGFAPHVLFLAGRAPAARFIEQFPYSCENCNPALREELLASLKGNPPPVAMVHFDELNRSEYRDPRTAQTTLEEFTELHRWLTEAYEPAGREGHFDFYRRRAPATEAP